MPFAAFLRPAYNELTRLPHLGTRATGNNARLHLGTTGDAHACKKITYPGINNKSEFTYGPGGGRVKIVETVSGSVTSTKQFVGGEERDGSGNVTKQFFAQGQINSSTNYFYGRDHLGSVRTMTDDSGVGQASYSFDPYGRMSKLGGTAESDFGFDGMYFHQRSGLNLMPTRQYSSSLGRWLGRDWLGEESDINLFAFSFNSPINYTDPSGLSPADDMASTLRAIKITQDTLLLRQHFLEALLEFNRTQPKGWGPRRSPRTCWGNAIDKLFKDRVRKDPKLKHLYVTPNGPPGGPDVIDLRKLDVWWDVTTPEQWNQHVLDYPEEIYGKPTPFLYEIRLEPAPTARAVKK